MNAFIPKGDLYREDIPEPAAEPSEKSRQPKNDLEPIGTLSSCHCWRNQHPRHQNHSDTAHSYNNGKKEKTVNDFFQRQRAKTDRIGKTAIKQKRLDLPKHGCNK